VVPSRRAVRFPRGTAPLERLLLTCKGSCAAAETRVKRTTKRAELEREYQATVYLARFAVQSMENGNLCFIAPLLRHMSAKDKAEFLRRVADRLEENLPDGRGRHDDRFREAYAKAKSRHSPSPRYLFFLPSVAEVKNVDEGLRRSHSDRGFRRALQRIGLPTRPASRGRQSLKAERQRELP
jgi:hypothetical protein